MFKKAVLSCLILVTIACAKKSDDPPGITKPTLSAEDFKNLVGLSDDGLVDRASANELGLCTLKISAKYFCADGPDYAVFLIDIAKYFPTMEASLSEAVITCRGYIGQNLRSALQEGFCYTNTGSQLSSVNSH